MEKENQSTEDTHQIGKAKSKATRKKSVPPHVGDVLGLHVEDRIGQAPLAEGVHEGEVVEGVGDRGPLGHAYVLPVELAGTVVGDDRGQAYAVAQRLQVPGRGQLRRQPRPRRFVGPRLLLGLLRLDLGDEGGGGMADPEQQAPLVVLGRLDRPGLGVEALDRREHALTRHHLLRVQDHQAFYHSHMRGLQRAEGVLH